MDVQMNSSIFKPSDLISILGFLHCFRFACYSNRIHEEPAMCLFPHFMKEAAKAALSYRLRATEENTTHKEGALATYCRVVNYILET